jgi:hypothetical protein
MGHSGRESYETFEKCSFLFKFKEGENFNHPSTIFRTYGASMARKGHSGRKKFRKDNDEGFL